MLPPSPTNDPLAPHRYGLHGHAHSKHPSDAKYLGNLRAVPLAAVTRTTSQLSSQSVASYSSTTELVPHPDSKREKRKSLRDRVVSWSWRSEKTPDSEMTRFGEPEESVPGNTKRKRIKAWQGWRFILFGSWFNVFLLLIPISWILKLATTESDTLIFTSCMLAMIPLVKLHDLAISVLSRRIGGTKTGLLNASFVGLLVTSSNITALRKCELRVVQSSLIGSILSKLLLILGMCFFAGGMRFSQQDFNHTATQIHSSLLSISVGAVCLPAAFHFALTYSEADAEQAGTTLDQQKQDLLKMSHSVFYFSYLLFQLWSHTHLYQDSSTPSAKLPVAVSMRSMTSRVRLNSGKGMRRSHSQACSVGSAQPDTPLPPAEAAEELPEMSWVMIIVLLTTVTVLVTIDAEWLVDSMDSLSPTLSKEWIGLILLPIVSSIAECVTAVNVSVKDQLTLSISVAVGSTIQTALFVIPFMVILGWILNKPLALLFDPFETVLEDVLAQFTSWATSWPMASQTGSKGSF
ncbi:hypothetical protein IEO21_07154 [Rhodonia placenta]|uniref:Sodium/calcium exchanger membrane region domain-containing protein n=1 Tax=Rhodonia placenta TaxID=104341 RepID=A0A8H7NYP6_9APHY|nr:hypothetical protein IEO21_07154 [Postia placenta]